MTNENTDVGAVDTYAAPTYGQPDFKVGSFPTAIPQQSKDPRVALRLIMDEIDNDGRNSADLGSYTCDYMDPEVDELRYRARGKNAIDKEIYTRTSAIGDRVVQMIQRWYGGTGTPNKAKGQILGSLSIGSSEAVMLGLIVHRANWEISWEKRKADEPAKYAKDKPFMLFARDVHTCWDKYMLYNNSPALIFDLSEKQTIINPTDMKMVIASTVGSLSGVYEKYKTQIMNVCGYTEKEANAKYVYELVSVVGAVVGTTFTGEMDDVEALNTTLVSIKDTKKIDIPIHVDAASGGFVIPFSSPSTKWNFGLPQIKSINVSLHKFGMVYPNAGAVVFRDNTVVDGAQTDPDKKLVYDISYLGGDFTDFTVNFSRGAAQILASYYNLIRFGLDGYKATSLNCMANAVTLRGLIEGNSVTKEIFKVISRTDLFPMVIWKLSTTPPKWTLTDLSNELSKSRWTLPAYKLPFTSSRKPDGTEVCRVVCRQDISASKITVLFDDMLDAIARLNAKFDAFDMKNKVVAEFIEHERKFNKFEGIMHC